MIKIKLKLKPKPVVKIPTGLYEQLNSGNTVHYSELSYEKLKEVITDMYFGRYNETEGRI